MRSTSAHRLIPARAGNTCLQRCQLPCSTAHPRSRGEHNSRLGKISNKDGSSPLARGTPLLHNRVAHQTRLIPARAGNTGASPSRRKGASAHPRSRGEHCRGHHIGDGFGGSSPLARGTHRCAPPPACLCRLIPARAGNTSSKSSQIRASTAHPRSRGEHTC